MDNNKKREIIMHHYSKPDNKLTELPNWSNNYLHSTNCVDEIWLSLKKDNNVIKDAKFKGIGCAVFLSSCDIFLNEIKNKNLEQVNQIINDYKIMINKENENFNKDILGNLIVFNDVKTHLNRLECASMIYKIVKDNIDSN
ncbi:iron-sulfur cluster assembly scaffold protein [Mesomycoplasma molare]|uniref:Iron-sulfur cluster assembly scaffold protein n=1 Tax=Mesomycoplasma molare TaxID=171288 RepID=A0ABY5TTJ1_9BACT|nr:iron-sulfur cluster assembly scaffold protein [Mesomycoplasma molare]UWD33900.1 iron-sulfur cluster assembly scaffold protein [Mesomycoplasma molare]